MMQKQLYWNLELSGVCMKDTVDLLYLNLKFLETELALDYGRITSVASS